MKLWYRLILMFLISMPLKAAAQSVNIKGLITDSLTGELIGGASIVIEANKIVKFSNNYGFYSISVSQGKVRLLISHVSYRGRNIELDIRQDTDLNIKLLSTESTLDTVSIVARNNRGNITQMSAHSIKSATIKSTPAVGNEPDLLKTIQLLPGVNVVNEGTTNLIVRGGSFDQNLILLDEAPVFNPSHALGFFSTFNADALRSVNFYKAGFPAQYGGRLSSVVDIYMKEGNSKKKGVEGSIGLLASRILWEGPIRKDSSSFIVTGRYSYLGHIVDGIGGLISKTFVPNNDISFYDLNAKFNFIAGKKDRIYFSTYTGGDRFYSYPLDESNKLRWGNTTGSFRWNRRYNSTLFSNLSLVFSNYRYSYFSLIESKQFLWKSNIVVGGLKLDFDQFASDRHSLKFGISAFLNRFQPGRVEQLNSNSVIRSFTLGNKHSMELAAYFSDEARISDKLSITAGLRFARFVNVGPGTVFIYDNSMTQITDSVSYGRGQTINDNNFLEPRISGRYQLGPNNSLRLSYAITNQFLHLISNSTVGLPTDVWVPSDRYIKPQQSQQVAVGFSQSFEKQQLDLSVEAYYKRFSNIIDYIDNANLFLNPQLETQTRAGKGRAFGIELLIEKRVGKLNGWFSYTLSSTKLKIPGVNNNEWFSARYDIRHNLSITGTYKLNDCWTFNSTFRLTSGAKLTVPSGDFTYFGGTFNFYSKRNDYTMPMYHRLDISSTFKSKKYASQKIKREWVFSLFNVYNRYNIFALFIKPDPLVLDEARAYNFYLYGIVPSVSLNLKL